MNLPVTENAGRRAIIVASENGRAGTVAAMKLLCRGGTALDAVELACRITEDDAEEHSVGYGGIPNVAGDVELDASIMDGRTLQTGAVAAVRGYAHPISLARRVMEVLPHVLLVGRGAEQFAAELGFTSVDQRTDESTRRWRERFQEYGLTPGADSNLRRIAALLTRPVNLQDKLAQAVKPDTLGTVNYLALDRQGNLASAVSTSGIAWKYPGRVGDSPLIGAGNYCDNRYGAVACTGMGELAIRVSTARSVVVYLKMGYSMGDAGKEALADLKILGSGPGQYMSFVVLTPSGGHAGFTTVPGKRYLFMEEDMAQPKLADRSCLSGGEPTN